MTSPTTSPTVDVVTVTADALTAALSPTDLYFLYYRLEQRLQGMSFPALTVKDTDDDANPLTGVDRQFICPDCDAVENEVISEDVAHRLTNGTPADGNENGVDFWYSGSDFQGLLYLCNNCHTPVSLPDGWTEE